MEVTALALGHWVGWACWSWDQYKCAFFHNISIMLQQPFVAQKIISSVSMKVSLVLLICLVFKSIEFSTCQLTFYPKFRWDKSQLVYDQLGQKMGEGSLSANKFQWDKINDMLKDQIHSNPIKVIQNLLSLGIKPGIDESSVFTEEKESKLQSNPNQKKAPKPRSSDKYLFEFWYSWMSVSPTKVWGSSTLSHSLYTRSLSQDYRLPPSIHAPDVMKTQKSMSVYPTSLEHNS